MDRVEQLETLIKDIFDKREKELNELEKAIEADNTSMDSARDRLEKATTNNNLEDYRQAKADLAFTNDRKELHKGRLNQLKNKPLITDIEYTKQVNEVLASVKDQQEKATEKALELITELEALADEVGNYTTRANKALERLYKDVYRLADLTDQERSLNVVVNNRTPQATYPTLSVLVDAMRSQPVYASVTGYKYTNKDGARF